MINLQAKWSTQTEQTIEFEESLEFIIRCSAHTRTHKKKKPAIERETTTNEPNSLRFNSILLVCSLQVLYL